MDNFCPASRLDVDADWNIMKFSKYKQQFYYIFYRLQMISLIRHSQYFKLLNGMTFQIYILSEILAINVNLVENPTF